MNTLIGRVVGGYSVQTRSSSGCSGNGRPTKDSEAPARPVDGDSGTRVVAPCTWVTHHPSVF